MKTNINDIQTPAILIRSKVMHHNLKKYQKECYNHNKQLWPMLKTHKSTVIAHMQKALGAQGFLCGTLDECEALCRQGIQKIMYAYPVAGRISCMRAAALAQSCDFYVRLDSPEAAVQLNDAAKAVGTVINYTAILDCGLHRFGLPAEKILSFVNTVSSCTHLHFAGISTHCGHVYSETDANKIPLYAEAELKAIHTAVDALKEAGYSVEMVTSGATPTFKGTIADDYINIYHPGNYIFHDRIQLANHTVTEEECALVVYATVISHPSEKVLICDAGAKCLGPDQGAHGNLALQGYGKVLGHPELLIRSLSEEVGVLEIIGSTDLKIGDRIMIIPNHSCSSANLTDYYFVIDEQQNVEQIIPVDIRSNTTTKGLFVKQTEGNIC